jgi:hypothetical protein
VDVEGVEAGPGLVSAWGRDVGDGGVEGEGCWVVDEGENFVGLGRGGWVVVVDGGCGGRRLDLCLLVVVGEVEAVGDGFGAGGGEEVFVDGCEGGVQGFVEAGVAEGRGALLEKESEDERTMDINEYSQTAAVFSDRVLGDQVAGCITGIIASLEIFVHFVGVVLHFGRELNL